MAVYDGSIRINTKISIKNAEVQLSALKSRMIKTADKVQALRTKMDALKNTQVPTQEYAALDQQLAKLGAEYDRLSEKQIRFLSTGGRENSSTYKRMEYDLNMIDQEQNRVISKMRELEAAGKAFTLGSSTQDFAQMEQQLRDMENDLERMSRQHEVLNLRRDAAVQKAADEQEKITAQAAEEQRLTQIREEAVVADQKLIDLLERRRELTERIREMERAGVTEGYSQHDNARQELSGIEAEIGARRMAREELEEARSACVRMSEVAKGALASLAKAFASLPISAVRAGINGLTQAFQRFSGLVSRTAAGSFKAFGAAAKKTVSSVAAAMLRLNASMLGFGKNVKKTNNILSGGLKNILKYGLGIRSLYALVNRLRTAIKEGFSNFYNYSGSFKNSIDGLKVSMLTLKNSFAAAFAPLVEVVIPYIQKVTGYITHLLGVIGQFTAAITGQKTYTKAVKQTAGAMKEAGKAAQGYLSPLDEINKFQKNDSGGADAGGAGGMFEEIPVSDRFRDIAQWLKDMWENSNFYELGKTLGEKLKDALDNIPWDGIKEASRKIGKSIASFINGFVEVEDLGKTIGHTLAEKINTGYEFLNSFVHELHWDSIGKFIADSISGLLNGLDWDLIYDTFVTGAKGLGDAVNSLVDNLDWESISTSISNFVNTFVDTIYTLISTTDWKALGEKIGKAISDAWNSVDWSKAGETVGEAFKAFFDFVSQTIENIDWQEIGQTVADFLVGIDWAGVAESFFEAVGAAFGGLAAFLEGLIEDAWDSVVQWWHDVAYEDGEFTISGLLDGIVEALKNIGGWIKEHIFQPFIDGFKKAFGIASPSKVMEEMGTYIIEGLLNGIKSLVGSVMEVWENMKETALRIWEDVKKKLSGIWETVKKTAVDIWEKVRSMFTEKFDAIREKAGEIMDKFNELKENVQTVFDTVREKISGVVDTVVGKIEKFIGIIKDAIKAVKDFFSSGIEKLGDMASGLFGGKSTSTKAASFSLNHSSVLSPNPAFASLANKEFPGYATGTVIPRTMQKHLAWLEDNDQEAEVVSPISTIEDALENTAVRLGLAGGNGNTYRFVAQLNGRILFEETIRQAKMQQMSTGRNPFVLE